jgi:hypothetical protein
MASDHKTHIKHAIIDTCILLDTDTSSNTSVLAIDSTNKLTRIPVGTVGQLLTYTGSTPHKIEWQTSSASSVAQYQTLSVANGGIGSDPLNFSDTNPIDGTKDVYAVEIGSSDNYSNYLDHTGVSTGHIVVITITYRVSGGRYRVYSDNMVFSGGNDGFLEMDSVGQGAQLVFTSRGWAVIGGGGAVLGTDPT